MDAARPHFRLCSSCKKPLPFESSYYRCSVTTCNRPRTELTFCSLNCFEAHVPVVRHREAWAEEARAPSRAEWEEQQAEELAAERQAAGPPRAAAPEGAARPERRIVGAAQKPAGPVPLASGTPREILIVASKLKSYIRARSGMNTSEGVLDVLSDIVRELCDAAVQKAAADGRKTLMDRDF
jgi:hypothetical protein